MFKKIKILLDMIKFEHTIFALPFAFVGAFLANKAVPDLKTNIWILVAMAGARTVAMAVNRIVDLRFDAKNPRTKNRPLVSGEVKKIESWILVTVAALAYFIASYNLTPLAFKLSPFILAILIFYSYTKRFTIFCHLFLGFAIGIAPTAGWIAVKNSIGAIPLLLSIGVMFWIAGFDILYACQDVEFDKNEGLYSIPASIGIEKAFLVSSVFHAIAFLAFMATGIMANLNWVYFIGMAATFVLLVLQRRVITPRDLSKMNIAFFRMNAAISVILFFATLISLYMPS